MRTLTPYSIKALAFALGLAVSAPLSASLITSFETLSDYQGSDISFSTGRALTQTFTNAVYIQSMTYRFVRTSGTGSVNLNYYFAEWDTLTNKATNLISSGSISVPPLASFTTYTYNDGIDDIDYSGYDYQFNLNYASNASTTYAMILVGGAGSTSVKLQLIDGSDNFPYGGAYRTDGITSFANLTTTAGSAYNPIGTDWGFSQIQVQLAAVPEPATAMLALGLFIVAGLVGLRLHQRRRTQALMPLQNAA